MKAWTTTGIAKRDNAKRGAGDGGQVADEKIGLSEAAGAVLQGPHAREEMPPKRELVNREKFVGAAIRAPSY